MDTADFLKWVKRTRNSLTWETHSNTIERVKESPFSSRDEACGEIKIPQKFYIARPEDQKGVWLMTLANSLLERPDSTLLSCYLNLDTRDLSSDNAGKATHGCIIRALIPVRGISIDAPSTMQRERMG